MQIRRGADSAPTICLPTAVSKKSKSSAQPQGETEKNPKEKIITATELVSMPLSFRELCNEGVNLLQKAMPHMYNVKSDNHNRKWCSREVSLPTHLLS